MINSILKKAISAVVAFFMIIFLGASIVQAANSSKAKITINVVDQFDRPITGLWFLKKGSTDKGDTIRNGTNSETFEADSGTYYLVTYKIDRTSAHKIISKNPQILTEGGSITYTVKYTRDPGYKTANQNPINGINASIIEKAKKRTSTVPVSNRQKITKKTNTVLATNTVSNTQITYVDTPKFSDAPVSPTKTASKPFRLAQTGPAATLPLLLASVFGFFALPKKRKD